MLQKFKQMKKQFITLCTLTILCLTAYAQKLEKIKGNKNVITQTTETNPFHTVILGDDFEYSLVYNQTPSVTIQADENLLPYIITEVNQDGVLTFKKIARLVSSKDIVITIKYNSALANIKVKDKAELITPTPLELENVVFTTEGTSKIDLQLKTDSFTLQSSEKSKIEIDVVCKAAILILNQNSKLEGLFFSNAATIELYDRANVNLNGESNTLNLKTDNHAQFDGEDLLIKTCTSYNNTASNAILNVSETVTIEASGNSSIYLYNTPDIFINKFTDTVKLQKKDR